MTARACSTAGCQRAPRPDFAMCDECTTTALFRRPPERARITRLSLSDPLSLALAAEIAARSGR